MKYGTEQGRRGTVMSRKSREIEGECIGTLRMRGYSTTSYVDRG